MRVAHGAMCLEVPFLALLGCITLSLCTCVSPLYSKSTYLMECYTEKGGILLTTFLAIGGTVTKTVLG